MNFLNTFIIILSLTLLFAFNANATDSSAQLASINYLLAVDRLDYYSDGLADHLQDHDKGEIAAALRQISPEDYHRQMYSLTDLNNTNAWNELILRMLKKKFPQFKELQLSDIQWNYNFFRNKLMRGFKAEPITFAKEISSIPQQNIEYTDQIIPDSDGSKILLDAERYISEKTTRGVFWDAATTGKTIELHMGTERDFRQRVQSEGREIVAEIKTRALNYNKIYLVLDPKNGVYSYAFTRISGNDRVSHLISQLRILKYENKIPLLNGKVRIYGDAAEVHTQNEKNLTEIFKTLPKADMVVIGQKSSIENVIATAGMMAQIQPDIARPSQTNDKKFDRVALAVSKENSYFAVTSKGGLVKSQFENIENPQASNYEILNIEQPSHDITDVLLEAKDGTIKRWRLISNMWGDEVIPVARALTNSGHRKVVYIGTAGAIKDKGFKVGDVVVPSQTYTQDGRLLSLENATYGGSFIKTGATLGQVRSPFDETAKWLAQWSSKIDLVELETGYLRENLGKEINFQPYLLISDIVGSEHETLAVASIDSGKRKSNQLKLLESLFIENGIKAPVANARPILADRSFHEMLEKIEALRPSRDITSKVQLAQLALRRGLTSQEELEKLIKSEPSFDRQMLISRLENASYTLQHLAQQNPQVNYVIVGPEDLLNGTWNAKKKLKIQIMVGDFLAEQAKKYLKSALASIDTTSIEIEVLDYDKEKAIHGLTYNFRSENILGTYYEKIVLKKAGLVKEYDTNGGVRFKTVHELSGGMRCEALFL